MKQLGTDEEVFAAACVVYFYSTDAVMDILESYSQYSYCTYLSKLLLQQTVLQLPLSLYSAFSVVLIKLLECDELKKNQDDLPLVNSTLANLNFEKAYNEVESQKIVCTLLRDICARFYTIVNGSTIEICCKFLDLQDDYPKLIELCSLRYFMNKFTQKEQKVADTAYLYFKNHYEHCVSARHQESESSEYSDSDDGKTEQLLLSYVQLFIQQMSHTQQIIVPVVLENYFLPFVLRVDPKMISDLIVILANNHLSVYKVLAV